MPGKPLISESAREHISAAVRQAEARSVGQIVPVVVERAGHYAEAGPRAALLGIALASPIFFWPQLLGDRFWLLFVGGVAIFMVVLTLAWPALERALVGGRALDAMVQDRALRAFVEHGVYRTRHETGVLIFASVFERRVVILGDRAIHEKMGEAGWKQAVEVLTSGLRRGRSEEGFLAAIESVGNKLAESFPRSGSSKDNELSDELRVDKS